MSGFRDEDNDVVITDEEDDSDFDADEQEGDEE